MDTTTLGIHYAWESFLTLNKKDDTPLITISTAEDDETMNGRKAG